LLPKGAEEDMDRDIKTAIKLPKEGRTKLNVPPHPHRQVDQVKFVKPVVAKAEEVTEEPPKIVEIKEKVGAETIKGDPDAVLSVAQ
jgi:protein TonB